MRTYRSRHPWRRAAPDWAPRMEPVDWILLGSTAAIAALCALAFSWLASVLGVA